uniref:Solute carrier family 22 member 4-like n=1 Tax=Callorhinchus milii TaxID=7868 RepID=A0A4W3J879_CALMI
MEKNMQDYGEATDFLGEWGPFQKTVFLLLSVTIIPNGYVGLSMVFLADIPQHHCRLPNSLNGTTGEANLSSLLPVEEVDGEMIYSQCRRYKTPVTDGLNDTTRETEPCVDGWEYSTDRYISTIVSQWDLVCNDDWKIPVPISLRFFGNLCGSLLAGHLSDRYGRKIVLFGGIAIQTILSLSQAAVQSWEMFCVLCFLIGVGDVSNYTTSFVLGKFLSLDFITHFKIFLKLHPHFCRFIPESPRWLLSQGRVEEAEAIVKAAAKKNGIKHVGEIFQRSGNTEYLVIILYCFCLMLNSKLRNITILNCCIWMITAISYYGLTLNTSNLHGNPYINCFISAFTDMIAYIISWRLMLIAPRRISTASMLFIGGTVLLLVQIVPPSKSLSFHILSMILVMIGKSGISVSYALIYIFAAELYPTVVRNTGLGASCMASRAATIFAPYFVYIGMHNKFLPLILMGILSIIAGLCCLILPDTHHQKFPDTIEQTQPIGLDKECPLAYLILSLQSTHPPMLLSTN